MKQISFFFILALSAFGGYAQQTCGTSYVSLMHSIELPYYAPSLSVTGHFRFLDSIQLLGTPSLDSNDWFTLAGSSGPSSGATFVDDSLVFQFNLITDTSATSYYPQEVLIHQRYIDLNNPIDTLYVSFKGYIYFTPWHTTEVYSDFDFFASERQWTLNPFDSIEPTKVYFLQASIPVSDINMTDTIENDWDTDYLLRTVEGAPFMVKQKMINPDTMAWYCEHYDDSASYYYEQAQAQAGNFIPPSAQMQFKKATHFEGTVSGRLVARMLNDHGTPQTVPLRGIQVRLLDKDGWFWEELDEVNTDENGNFTLTCDENMSTLIEGNNLELFIQYRAKNKEYNFEIVRPTIDALDWDIFGQAVFREEDLGEHANDFDLNLGDVFLGNQDQAFRTANFIWNSYDYCKNNVGISDVEHDLTKYKLKIHINTGGANFSGLPKSYIVGGLYGYIDRPTIRLNQARVGHESTIYHEFGHYLMYCAADHTFPKHWSENNCGVQLSVDA